MSEVTDVILTVEPADDGHVADSSFFKRATSPLGRTGNRFDWPAHAPHRADGREAVGGYKSLGFSAWGAVTPPRFVNAT